MASLSSLLPPGNLVTEGRRQHDKYRRHGSRLRLQEELSLAMRAAINDNSWVAVDRHLFALEHHNG